MKMTAQEALHYIEQLVVAIEDRSIASVLSHAGKALHDELRQAREALADALRCHHCGAKMKRTCDECGGER